jgi:hypothetical protein
MQSDPLVAAVRRSSQLAGLHRTLLTRGPGQYVPAQLNSALIRVQYAHPIRELDDCGDQGYEERLSADD